MFHQTSYQLHGYKIVEHNGEILEWVKYSDFGIQQSGRCWVIRNVLVLGDPSNEEIGYLIGEHYDHLRKLPKWSKTKYYCREDAIIGVAGKKPAVGKALSLRADRHSKGDKINESSTSPYPGRYRLGVYMLEVKPDQTITWSTYLGNGRIGEGIGEIFVNTLFLTEKTLERNQSRRQFQTELKSLPAWPFTEAYVPFGAVALCAESASPTGHFVTPDKKYSPVTDPKRKRIAAPKNDRAPRPEKTIIGPGPYHRNTGKQIEIQAPFRLSRPYPVSWTQKGAAFIFDYFSGTGTSKKKTTPKPDRRFKRFWKAGLAGILITTLAAGALVVLFFHHEFDGLTQMIHPGGHSRAHHYKHHSHR